MYALDCAYSAIRSGEIEAALVCGANLYVSPFSTISVLKTGALSAHGFCRPFDHEADGYVRSEAVGVLFLQKSKDAKRIYAKVVHSKTNCDGYKEEGNYVPSTKMQIELMAKFYREVNIDPSIINYVEAHGTGKLYFQQTIFNANFLRFR
jgi:fatty acid synthase